MEKIYHKSVMVKEVLEYLIPDEILKSSNNIYVDVTFGAGGHTRAILEKDPNCKVIAFDWDKNAIDINGPLLKEKYGNRFELVYGNFANIKNLLKKLKIEKVNGILADFGTSQYQIKNSPGLSFNIETPLDMRISSGHSNITAYDIINKLDAKALANLFYEYAQEHNSRKIANAIIQYRKENGKIKTTTELASIIENIIPKKKIHPATKVFQALRIYINNELNNIKSLLSQSIDLLDFNARIVCISFHSLEDTIVKNFFKNNTDQLNILTKHIIKPSLYEIKENPSARSAKLRAAEKIFCKTQIIKIKK